MAWLEFVINFEFLHLCHYPVLGNQVRSNDKNGIEGIHNVLLNISNLVLMVWSVKTKIDNSPIRSSYIKVILAVCFTGHQM